MSVKIDDGAVDTVKEYGRMTGVTLFPGARFHLILAAVVQGLIWCALAALWMPAVFATAVITHDDYNDGQDDGLPMLLLIPSCVVILLGLLDYIWHDGIYSPARYHSPMLLLFPRVVRRAQQIVLAITCLFGAWYGCMVLLWFLLALLLRGAAALPAVLMVVGGAAVILRQRARAREGAFQNLMSIDNEIENVGRPLFLVPPFYWLTHRSSTHNFLLSSSELTSHQLFSRSSISDHCFSI
jgi:hypothetical protein